MFNIDLIIGELKDCTEYLSKLPDKLKNLEERLKSVEDDIANIKLVYEDDDSPEFESDD
jgi:hypothetical protein